MNTRTLAVALAATAAGALAGPPVVAVAKDVVQQVVVQNTADNPVVTRATGTTDVKGTVGLASGTSVKLADGSVVGLADGAKVALTDNTVKLADGSAFKLADGSKVQLAAGSAVALADGSEVKLDGPVQLADGAKVALADNTTVRIGNDDSDPLPVKVVGGGAAEPARQAVSFRSIVLLDKADSSAVGPGYTVPAGKTLLITQANGLVATEHVGRVSLERRLCEGPGTGVYHYGVLSGAHPDRVWHMPGEFAAGPGCQLVPVVTQRPGLETGHVSFHLFGYLIDG